MSSFVTTKVLHWTNHKNCGFVRVASTHGRAQWCAPLLHGSAKDTIGSLVSSLFPDQNFNAPFFSADDTCQWTDVINVNESRIRVLWDPNRTESRQKSEAPHTFSLLFRVEHTFLFNIDKQLEDHLYTKLLFFSSEIWRVLSSHFFRFQITAHEEEAFLSRPSQQKTQTLAKHLLA